jgi:Fe-S-cluster containining protein
MPLPADYPELLARLDQWQDDVRNRFPGVVPCRAGCTACCHGPFDISSADALLVGEAVGALPASLRDAVRERARTQLERMTAQDPAFRNPWDVAALGEDRFDALVEARAADPCPALDEGGRCLIYEARPMICRIMGLGIRTGAGELLENACPIQEEFPAYRDLPPQAFDLAGWDAEEARILPLAARRLLGATGRATYETTIAGAVQLGAG